MDAQVLSPARLTAAVARLERQVRFLRTVLASCVVAAAGFAGLALASAPPSVVEAQRIVLRGPRGVGRVEIAIAERNRLRITLFDFGLWAVSRGDSIPIMSNGVAELELRAGPPELRLNDVDHNPIVRLGPRKRLLR